jgi:hypothetical protein
VDFAPVHVITTATLDHVGVEPVRHRPNLILDIPGAAPYEENDWADREISIGLVVLRVMCPTPRCAVPTLAHGPLPRRTEAVRVLMTENRIPGSGPCLGAYAEVVRGGMITAGDIATVG